jgi:hypothetical protein
MLDLLKATPGYKAASGLILGLICLSGTPELAESPRQSYRKLPQIANRS